MTIQELNSKDTYRWIEQDEVLKYLGKEGNWYQFALIEKPNIIWCEVLEPHLSLLEVIH